MTQAELNRYFRAQEQLSAKRQIENQVKQRSTNSRKTKPNNSKKRSNETSSSSSNSNTDNKPKMSGARITDDTPCPVHPGSSHTWGQCFLNKHNPRSSSHGEHNKRPKTSNQSKDKKDHYMAEQGTKDSTIEIDDASDGSGKEPCSSFTVETVVDYESFLTSEIEQNESTSSALDVFMTIYEDVYSTGSTTEINDISNMFLPPHTGVPMKPIGILIANEIQGFSSKQPLRVLFNIGSDRTFINHCVLPKGATPKTVEKTTFTTVKGSKGFNQEVVLKDLRLPEFSPTRKIDQDLKALVLDHPDSPYDVILGLDFLVPVGIDIRCTTKTLVWDDCVVPWKPKSTFTNQSRFGDHIASIADSFFIDEADAFASDQQGVQEILESKYDEHHFRDIAEQQQHLPPDKRKRLASVLSKYTKLFNGKLRAYPNYKVHLERAKDCKPFSTRPYPVAQAHMDVFKQELDRLVEIGVLSPCGPAKFLSPSFIIPKKDGRVRWITDFRKLNSMISRQVYNLPTIQGILKKRNGYKYFTKLDISMQYYTFELDDESKDLCTICTPFGNYRYNRLPMGVKQSPDIAQEVMEDLFRDLPYTEVYIDDIGVCFYCL